MAYIENIENLDRGYVARNKINKNDQSLNEGLRLLENKIDNPDPLFKGDYATVAALEQDYPPQNNIKGYYAWVASSVNSSGVNVNPYRKYQVERNGGAWIATNQYSTRPDGNVVYWDIATEDEEYLPVLLDEFEQIIFAIRKSDGVPFIPKLIDALDGLISSKSLSSELSIRLANIVSDVSKLQDDGIVIIEDDEWKFAIADNLQQIIFGIRQNNKIYPFDELENRVLKLEQSGTNSGDHSNQTILQLPFPRSLARVDVEGNLNGISKGNSVRVLIKYNDMQGNFFEKLVDFSFQGSSSMAYPKKNYAYDLLNADGTDFIVKFGDWVSTNSGHFKANYIDFTQARNIICARQAHAINMAYPLGEQHPWDVPYSFADSILNQRFDTGARGVIDGFPFELYLNGEYQGIYTWNLKKHRDNYQMNKSNPKHIQLEMVNDSYFIFPINWSAWEIRNPKGYESGIEPPTGEVKDSIERLFQWASSVNATDFKIQAKDYLFIDKLIDFYILTQSWYANDIIIKNTQVCTWDGIKWAFQMYDLDTVFGLHWNGGSLLSATLNLNIYQNAILKNLEVAFADEIKTRYAELRKTFLSPEYVQKMYEDFINIIGYEAYKRDAERWTDIPSNSSCYTSLAQIMDWYKKRLVYTDNLFSYQQ